MIAIFIVVPAALYLLVALAVANFAQSRISSLVPEVVIDTPLAWPDNASEGCVYFELSREQRGKRDFWSVVRNFSIIWPFELIAAVATGTYRAGRWTINFLTHLGVAQNEAAAKRLLTRRVEEARARIQGMAISAKRRDEMLDELDKQARKQTLTKELA